MEIIQKIPEFSGTCRNATFREFEKAFLTILPLIPKSEKIQKSYQIQILKRIQGPARTILINRVLLSVKEILDSLSEFFKEERTMSLFYDELANTHQYLDESLEEFLKRLEELGELGIAAGIEEYGQEFTGEIEMIMQTGVIERFEKFAPPEIRSAIYRRNATTIDHVFRILRNYKYPKFHHSQFHPTSNQLNCHQLHGHCPTDLQQQALNRLIQNENFTTANVAEASVIAKSKAEEFQSLRQETSTKTSAITFSNVGLSCFFNQDDDNVHTAIFTSTDQSSIIDQGVPTSSETPTQQSECTETQGLRLTVEVLSSGKSVCKTQTSTASDEQSSREQNHQEEYLILEPEEEPLVNFSKDRSMDDSHLLTKSTVKGGESQMPTDIARDPNQLPYLDFMEMKPDEEKRNFEKYSLESPTKPGYDQLTKGAEGVSKPYGMDYFHDVRPPEDALIRRCPDHGHLNNFSIFKLLEGVNVDRSFNLLRVSAAA